MEEILNYINVLIAKYPWAAHIAAGLIFIRVINKPLFALLHKYVEFTKSTKDNELLKKIVSSKTYKVISFILDLTLSIKLKK